MRDEEQAAALAALPGWQQERGAIRRIYAFAGLEEARKFVRRLVDLALADEQTPAVEWSGGEVRVALGRAGGVTRSHIEFAERIDGTRGADTTS